MFSTEYFEEISNKLKIVAKNESCESCKFIFPTYDKYFICRRNPPQITPSETGGYGRRGFGIFPTVDKDCWCGEYMSNKY